jgi:hypothetical protein
VEVPELQQDQDAEAKGDDRILTPAFTAMCQPEVLIPSFGPKYFAEMPIRIHELSPLRIESADDQAEYWRRVVTFVFYWPETVSLFGLRHRI